MSEGTNPETPDVPLETVARQAAEIATEADLAGVLSKFLELVKGWAAPSAVVAVVRDPEAESGWRLLPALCSGSVPVGIDRSVARLVAETPDCLVRPGIFRGEEIAGVRVRDNVTVPWSAEGATGLLLLRGVPRPFPANLGAALSLAALPVWPRLLGGPASRLEALLAELRSASARLEAESGRYAERLLAQDRPVTLEAPPDDGRVAALEAEKAAAVEAGRQAEEALGAARARVEELEKALAATQAERDARAAEARELTGRVDTVEAERQAALDVRARVEELEKALTSTQAERDARAAEARELTGRVDTVEAERQAALDVRARAEEAIAAAAARAQELERALSAAVASRETDGARARDFASRVETLEAERDAAVEARRRADQSLATASEQAEERRRAAEAAEARASRAEEELLAVQRDLALTRARSTRSEEAGDQQARLDEARAAGAAAEARARDLQARWEKTGTALLGAITALRRAAFVPPSVRVPLGEAASFVEAGPRPARRLGVALLDRDVVGLEPLAAELEAAGIEARVASQPEELALFLRTLEAGAVDAVVCDVMSFRPDQNVAGLIRSWDKDRPGLAFFLSYDGQNAAEAERARRIPMSLTAGHLARPLALARLVEAVENLARKQGKG